MKDTSVWGGYSVFCAPYCQMWFIVVCTLKFITLIIFLKKGVATNSFAFFFGFIGGWSNTPPAPLNEYTFKVSGFAEKERFVSCSRISRFSKLFISVFGFLP